MAAQGDRPVTEAAWKRRFRAPRFGFPQWARDRPDRIIYGGNHEGTFEVYALDLSTGVERRLTSRKEGTGYRVPPRIDPQGNEVWWWDDVGGSEHGVWRVQPFEGGEARLAAELAPAHSAITTLGPGFAPVGRSGDHGTTIQPTPEGARPIRPRPRSDGPPRQAAREHRVGGRSAGRGDLVRAQHARVPARRRDARRNADPSAEVS